ncbi:FixH family protein [Sporosarcina thermotolerans]|uniref:FixH family protein n=1 Tax=Sporosarcina thermotolerans TaxID=633404 RepID=A0AAW9A7T7_9BACL|nr:FixH family protein [Sporosarcina thermotolerans]MDW0117089.1 FixH family protein [Sporosarcina thermotolerans]WHT47817.1 FixH family protein [Sporosarcina thermotolerans]
MKKKFSALLVIFGLLVLSACGKEVDDGSSVEVLPLLVDLSVTEHAEVGETVKMEALVTYGDEKVEDADKVVYEVWEDGKKDDSIMIDSVNEKNGLYTAETSFEKDGLYHIQVHVDAKRLHSMPFKEVTIGKGPNVESHDDEHADQGHEHGHTEGFSLHFVKPENAEAGAETELMTHLQIDGQPLEKANVRYQVWGDSLGEKHLWIDTIELKAGEYTAAHSFDKTGTYTVKIHVKDDNGLHEHEEFTFEVH